jgi:diamine N-acetyltransferase
MQLTEIKPEEAEELSVLCRTIYQQSYPYLWDDGGQWYMQTRYNAAKLLSEITDPNVAYFFVMEDDKKVGYLKINQNSDIAIANVQSYGDTTTKMYEADFELINGLEVERLYFLDDYTGKGLGQQAMDYVFDFAQKQHKNYVWLHCMDSSKAQYFYLKYGFKISGETILPFEGIATQYRRMYKMWKTV